MSETLGSIASLSKSAGGLSAGLKERNHYWIILLERRIAEVEDKMRASGDLERSRQPERAHELAAANATPAPANLVANSAPDGTAPAATPVGSGWGLNGFTNGAVHSGDEAAG